MRILWLYGPPAVGKSVTAWELLNTMSARDPATGYVDIDQLGMSSVDDDGDPESHKLQGRALAAVAAEFARSGVRTLVVSGVMGHDQADFYAAELYPYQPVFVRLTTPYAELRHRMSARGDYAEDWVGVEQQARRLDTAGLEHPVFKSGPASPAEVAARILGTVAGLVDEPQTSRAVATPRVSDELRGGGRGQAILIGGTTAVGKSTVGWQAFMAARERGLPSAFVDLRQLGFVGVGGGEIDHDLQARAARALWRVFTAHGAKILILNGPVNTVAEVLAYRAELAETHFDAIRLTAERSELIERVRARMRGEMASLAGDSLVGRTANDADAIVDAALGIQESANGGDVPTLDTTRLDPLDSAQRILSRLDHADGGWERQS